MTNSNRSAWRSEKWIEYFDPSTNTVTTYDRTSQILTRSEANRTPKNDFVLGFVDAIAMAAKGRSAGVIRGMEVVSQSSGYDGDHPIALLELKSLHGHGTAKAKITIDPTTNLPKSAKLMRGGSIVVSEIEFSYPKTGPENIYSLGVSVGTELVDRVPSSDVRRLAAEVYDGRMRFDDYRSVVIKSSTLNPFYYGPGSIHFVAKRGDDLLVLRNQKSLAKFNDMSTNEVAEEVLQDPESIQWRPLILVKKDLSFRMQAGNMVPSKLDRTAEHFIFPSWHLIPHMAGRPPLGIGRGDISAALVRDVEGGPESCVLLQANVEGRIPEAMTNPGANGTIRRRAESGFWVRPDRDYLVMRDVADSGEGPRTNFEIELVDQSPQGFWFPTKAIKPGYKMGDRVISPSHYSYHLDFKKKVPSRWFDPNVYE